MNGSIQVLALHGFLGHPADWDVLRPVLPGMQVEALNLWTWLEESGADSWQAAGEALDALLIRVTGEGGGRKAFVLAYSFGGRLALASRALAEGRAGIGGACLVSCNPGLAEADAAGRTARRDADEKWARLLLDAQEDDILRAWEAQPVLASRSSVRAGGPASLRRILPAARGTLARAMRDFSLAGQPDFRQRLHGWATPLLWVTGENDAKFAGLADGLQRDGVPATFIRCPGAGHRVPWDNPEGFARIFNSWINK